MNRNPMLWMGIAAFSFVLLFVLGGTQISGMVNTSLQAVTFGGMIFSILYAILLEQHQQQKKQEESRGMPPY